MADQEPEGAWGHSPEEGGGGLDHTFAAFSPAVTACAFTVSPLTATPAYAARFSSSEDVASLLMRHRQVSPWRPASCTCMPIVPRNADRNERHSQD